MKTKLFLFLIAIGLFLTIPVISNGQGYTDEELDFQGSDVTNDDFGPVSLDPVYIEGNLSFEKQSITLNYRADLGVLTIWIVDENGLLYFSEEVNTLEEKTTTIDIKALPAQKYTIICFNPKGQQKADFELIRFNK